MQASWTVSFLLLPLMACGSVPPEPADRVADIREGGQIEPSRLESEELAKARKLLDESQMDAAESLLRSMIETRPELAEARQLLGRTLAARAKGDPPDLDLLQDAETELLVATRLDPARSEAWLDLGLLYEMEGHFEAALEAYRKSLRSNVYYKPGLLAAARLATQLGEERDAIRHLG